MASESPPEPSIASLQAHIRTLEAELDCFHRSARLAERVDDAIESAIQSRISLKRAMAELMPMLVDDAGAVAVWVTTLDEQEGGEDRQGCSYSHPSAPNVDPQYKLSHQLDVAGESFGTVTLGFATALPEQVILRKVLLRTWCEQVDNYLAATALARRKHNISLKLSDAIVHPILEHGIARAIETIQQTVALRDLLLVFCHEDDRSGHTLSFKFIKDGELRLDSSHPRTDDEDHRFLIDNAKAFLSGADCEILQRFGLSNADQQVLINGVVDQRVIGRLVVSSKGDEFNPFERDLLQLFADHLRQRIVDFNRQYKHLSFCFPPGAIGRILSQENYERDLLRPTVRDVAVMYCDISGFTRISERILRSPALIGKLIDTWSAKAVDAIWSTGGVFDKMVGDCVIGLWGPPFFEAEAQDQCKNAIKAAKMIRALTLELAADPSFPELADAAEILGVSTGIHYCPMYVGLFGPNDDYTGFSAGMNNAARLQGVATRNEILCMQAVVTAIGSTDDFGPVREAVAKNVDNPLVFRAVTSDEPEA